MRGKMGSGSVSGSVGSDSMTPQTAALPASSVHGILQARALEWVTIPFSGDLAHPGIEPRSLALQVDSLPSEPPGKPMNTGVVAYPFSMDLPDPGIKRVSCIAGGFFTN